MNTKKQTLIFFQELEDSALDDDFVLSALQDFETSLFLVAEQRWPSVTSVLWGACEKLLKRITGEPDMKAEDLQKKFKNMEPELSEDLHNKSHKYRQLRNEIIHAGFSPEFDVRCVREFFCAGVPYFERLLHSALGDGKEALSGNETKWFWEVYRNTRIAVSRSDCESTVPYGALHFLTGAAKKVTANKNGSAAVIGGRTAQFLIATQNMFNSHNEAFLEFEKDFREAAVSKVAEASPLFDFGGIHCPVCKQRQGLLGIDWEESGGEGTRYEFAGFNRFVCYNMGCELCLVSVSNKEALKVFFEDELDEEDRMKLGDENFLPVDCRKNDWWIHPDGMAPTYF